MANQLAFFEADFGECGVFVIGGAVAGGAGDDGVEALGGEVEEGVVFARVDAFKRAGIDADECGGGHEVSEGYVNLAGGPLIDPSLARAGDDIGHHHVAVETEGFERDAADLCNAGEIFFHVGNIDFVRNGKNDEVRGVGNLGLVPRVRAQLGAEVGIGDDKELPRLEAVG